MSVKALNKNNFNSEVLQSTQPVLVDFWAPWCGPCRMMSPIVDKIAEEVPGAHVGKVNVDEEQELAIQYGVMSIPTLMVFRGGKPAQVAVGMRPKEAVLQMLQQ